MSEQDTGSSKNQKVYDQVRRRAIESESWRDVLIDGQHTLRELWSVGPRRFHGDHWSSTPFDVRVKSSSGGTRYVTVNRTQTAIVSTVAVMTERPMRVTFQPVETADEGLYYAKPKSVRVFQAQAGDAPTVDLAAMFGEDVPTPEQMAGQEAFSEGQYEILTEQPLIGISGELGMMPLFTEDDFFKLNDSSAGDSFQTVYDALFDRACGDAVMAEHALYMGVVGTQFLLFQWDHDKRAPKFINVDIMNVRPDPVHTRVEDMDYLILDQVMTVEAAIVAWPKSEKAIEEASVQGKFHTASSENELAGRYQRTEFGREMVQVRTMWERGFEYPLSDPNDKNNPHHMEGVDLGYFEKDDGGGYVPKEGVEVPEKIRGIRQVVLLPQLDAEESIMEDQRCPYLDIPVCSSVNVPIIGSPYGLGEPQRLEGIQNFINELATTIATHLEFYKFPQEFWPQTLLKTAETALGGKWYQNPGVVIGVPDDDFKMWFMDGKRTSFAAERPPLPTDMVNILQLFLEMHDQMSGHVAVLQGRPPSADSSGVAIQELQQQARGPIGYKSAHIQDTLKRLGMLVSDAIIKFLPEWDWTRYNSKYPEGVALAFRDHVKSMRFDVSSEVVSGRGATKESDRQLAIQRRHMVPPTMSLKTFIEKVDEDPERELKRLEDELPALGEGENPASPFDGSGALPGQKQTA